MYPSTASCAEGTQEDLQGHQQGTASMQRCSARKGRVHRLERCLCWLGAAMLGAASFYCVQRTHHRRKTPLS